MQNRKCEKLKLNANRPVSNAMKSVLNFPGQTTANFIKKNSLTAVSLALIFMISVFVLNTGKPDSGIMWKEKIKVASGDAHQGPWRMNDSEFHYVDDPAVFIREDGSIGIVWADQPEQDIYFRLLNPDGEPTGVESVNVSQSPGIFSWLPRMEINPDNESEIYVLWQDIVFSGGSHGGEIFFTRSVDGGVTFTEPSNLSNTASGAGKGRLSEIRWDNGSLDIAIGPEGNIYTAWTEYEGALRFSRSEDSGETFSNPIQVAGSNSSPARGPALTADNEGTVYIAWAVGEDNSTDIYIARSDDMGESFSDPEPAVSSNRHSDAPKIAVDNHRTLHLVYAEGYPGMRQQYEILYTQMAHGEDAFREPEVLSGQHSGQVESANFPDMTLDSEGNPYLVWHLYPDGGRDSRGLGFTYSNDGGSTFFTPQLVPESFGAGIGNNGNRQGSLTRKIAVNRSGEIVIANSTFLRGQSSYIWIFRADRGE